jgi:hypothetical protein
LLLFKTLNIELIFLVNKLFYIVEKLKYIVIFVETIIYHEIAMIWQTPTGNENKVSIMAIPFDH